MTITFLHIPCLAILDKPIGQHNRLTDTAELTVPRGNHYAFRNDDAIRPRSMSFVWTRITSSGDSLAHCVMETMIARKNTSMYVQTLKWLSNSFLARGKHSSNGTLPVGTAQNILIDT